MRHLKILAAIFLSFLIVKRFFSFSDPIQLAQVVGKILPKSAYTKILTYFSKRSYAREHKLVEIYYKGKRIKIRSSKSNFSPREKELIFNLQRALEKLDREGEKF